MKIKIIKERKFLIKVSLKVDKIPFAYRVVTNKRSLQGGIILLSQTKRMPNLPVRFKILTKLKPQKIVGNGITALIMPLILKKAVIYSCKK